MKIPATISVDGENVRVVTTPGKPGTPPVHEPWDPEKYNPDDDPRKIFSRMNWV